VKIDNKTKEEHTTHFGYKKVLADEKTNLVGEVFHSVANKYDLMNDVMSFGLHRLWKQFLLREAQVKPNDIVLDVAGGTGDLAKAYAKKVGAGGKVILSDINATMLQVGRDRLIDAGLLGKFECVQADCERLPFVDHHFDMISIAFGLRNVTNQNLALSSLYRVLKPGGKLLILEFSHPESLLINRLYDWYSFNVIPKMGGFIAKDEDSYQYLVESIRMHPNQETLKQMMLESGFQDVEYFNLSGGIVALHKGYKY
jgi:demethylmenaquinone methyltransferase/2-methoxy-6-polyprenyl-1,4-benzoquinol methylase